MKDHSSTPASESEIIDQLTAYLDGELEADQIREVEERLASDQRYRELLQQLQRTWDVLDVLPSAAAMSNSSFTQSTMKLVIGDAKELTRSQSQSFWTWPIRILALILIPSIASAGTFLASRYIKNIPNQQLIQNLSTIRNLDVYNCDKKLTVDFLEKLAGEGDLFGIVLKPDTQTSDRSFAESDEAFLSRMDSLSAVERERIRTNNENYQQMSSIDLERVRSLIADIKEHPEKRKLESVLRRYHSWLKTLGETDTATILDTADENTRIEKIKTIAAEQAINDIGKTSATRLPVEDAAYIYLGFMWLIQDKAEDIVEALDEYDEALVQSEVNAKIKSNEIKLSDRETFVGGQRLRMLYEQHPEQIDTIITEDTISQIRNLLSLSQDALEIIDATNNWRGTRGKSEAQLLVVWMLNEFDSRFNPVTPQTLREFYGTLTPAEKDEVDNEFPEDRTRKLKEMYQEQFFR